ncbi:hypothetical protein AVEN_203969-1 [Araneus ventricosus]|uniref:Uncharacterized protein n=1 Tax=Araneus ventricosus TaxID=182803 RepID=A0A4Y2SZW4_ARAVE|nr:hypothetical protein AVEN_203969-1 [Araneus ventricosus]
MQSLTNNIIDAYHNSSRPVKDSNSLFIPPHIRKIKTERSRLKRIWQSSRDPLNKNLYNRAQALFRRQINNYTQDTYQSDIEQLDTIEVSIWRRTRNLKTKHFEIPQMKHPSNNFPAHTEREKAEIITNHFETQFKLNIFGTASTENTVSKFIEKFFTQPHTKL